MDITTMIHGGTDGTNIFKEVIPMRIKTMDIASTGAAQFFLYHFVQTYCLTFNLKVENENEWIEHYKNSDGKVLFCGFHQQFFSVVRYFKKYKIYKKELKIRLKENWSFCLLTGITKMLKKPTIHC